MRLRRLVIGSRGCARRRTAWADSNMGHAYGADEGCNETVVLGACFSAEDGLMDSVLNLHGQSGAFG